MIAIGIFFRNFYQYIQSFSLMSSTKWWLNKWALKMRREQGKIWQASRTKWKLTPPDTPDKTRGENPPECKPGSKRSKEDIAGKPQALPPQKIFPGYLGRALCKFCFPQIALVPACGAIFTRPPRSAESPNKTIRNHIIFHYMIYLT